jgi:putative MATE family efflux protein
MQQESNNNAIIQGVIWKQILIFFVPVALGTFFQQMYNTADALVVGNFVGMSALAAVGGVTGSVINLITGFFVGISSGATVAIAQHYGANNREGVSRVVHTTAALSLAAGAVLTVVGILYVPGTLRLLNQPQELMADSTTYMRIYFAGIIPALVYNIGSGVLRAVGDSRRPMYYLIVCCIVNVVLDLVFVAVLRWGVAGAAWATTLSQVVSASLVTIRLLRTQESYRLIPRKIRFHLHEIQSILRIGLPAGLQSLMYSISNVFIQSRINLYGANTVASWTVLGKVDGLSWLVLGAFGISVTTFVGQNFGAGRLDRVRRSIHVASGMAFAFTALFSAVILTFGGPLYRLFGADGEVLETGMRMLWLIGPFYSLFVPVEILSGAMRGVGETLIPMLITCVGVCLTRIVWILIAYQITPAFEPVVISYPVTWALASLAFLIYYKSGKWLSRARGL